MLLSILEIPTFLNNLETEIIHFRLFSFNEEMCPQIKCAFALSVGPLWSRGITLEYAVARLLGLRVRILAEGMDVCVC